MKFEEFGKMIDDEFNYHQEQICHLRHELELHKKSDQEIAEILRFIANKLEGKD